MKMWKWLSIVVAVGLLVGIGLATAGCEDKPKVPKTSARKAKTPAAEPAPAAKPATEPEEPPEAPAEKKAEPAPADEPPAEPKADTAPAPVDTL